MVQLVEKLDIITFTAIINGQRIIVWEFENDFVIQLHLMECKLALDIEVVDIE